MKRRPIFLWSPVTSQAAAPTGWSGADGAPGDADAAATAVSSGRVSVIVMGAQTSTEQPGVGERGRDYTGDPWSQEDPPERRCRSPHEDVDGHGREEQGDVRDRVGEEPHRSRRGGDAAEPDGQCDEPEPGHDGDRGVDRARGRRPASAAATPPRERPCSAGSGRRPSATRRPWAASAHRPAR